MGLIKKKESWILIVGWVGSLGKKRILCCTWSVNRVRLCEPMDCSPPGCFSSGTRVPSKMTKSFGKVGISNILKHYLIPRICAWVFIERTDVEAKTPILWPPDVKSWLIWKDPDAGKDWGQEEKGTMDNEMVGWHHQHNGHEFGWTLAVGDGQGGLACCGSWGRKELDMTEQLNWTDNVPQNFFQEEYQPYNWFHTMKSFLFQSLFQYIWKQPYQSISVNFVG